MSDSAQVTIVAKNTQNTTVLIAAPTKVTIGDTHAHNSIDIDTKNCKEEMVERKEMIMEMMILIHLIIYVWVV